GSWWDCRSLSYLPSLLLSQDRPSLPGASITVSLPCSRQCYPSGCRIDCTYYRRGGRWRADVSIYPMEYDHWTKHVVRSAPTPVFTQPTFGHEIPRNLCFRPYGRQANDRYGCSSKPVDLRVRHYGGFGASGGVDQGVDRDLGCAVLSSHGGAVGAGDHVDHLVSETVIGNLSSDPNQFGPTDLALC